MGPTSDLGPIDPQFRLADGSLAAGKAIIAAVDDAEERLQANPATFPLHAALLSEVTALMVQQARDAIARSEDQLQEALTSQPDRLADENGVLASALGEPLIGGPQSHAAIISADDAASFGLPVQSADPRDPQWQAIWRIWTKYVAIGPMDTISVYEGDNASQVFPLFAEE